MPLGVPPREGRNRGETRSVQPGDLPARRKRNRRTGCSATGWMLRGQSPSRSVLAHLPRDAPSCDLKDRMDDTTPPRATLTVCITCKRDGMLPDDARPGAQMYAELSTLPRPEGVTLRPVECLSACANGCSVALQAPGKWSYIYGNLDPALHAPDILRGAGLYAASPDGIVAWRDRPQVFRKQSLARVPPLEQPHD